MEWQELIEQIYLAVSRVFDGFFKFIRNSLDKINNG